MRSFIRKICIGCILALGISTNLSYAAETVADGKIDHFTIIAPPTTRVGEAIDITVEAKDKDDKIITGYRGSIFFQSDTDFGAALPAQGKAIQFKESDNGVLKISKGVTFKRIGNQELMVTEAREDATGVITIRVEEGTATTPITTAEEITVTTPEKGATLTTDNYMMSGKTKKNSKVTITLNGTELGTTQSDDTGLYTFNITGITQQTNILTASVYDGANTLVGTVDVPFSFGIQAPTYYNTTITPGTEVDASTGITLTIDAEPSLSEVSITLDGTTLKATESSPGKYTITTTSPAKSGTYPIQVSLKNIISQVTNKPDAAILTVKEAIPVTTTSAPTTAFKDVKITTTGTRVNLNFFVENIPADITAFKIAYGETAESLSESVTTWTVDKIKQADGSYNWYIDKLAGKTYVFKIFGLQGSALSDSLISEPLSATIGQGTCTIGNISTVNISTLDNKSILSWTALSGAISYNIYRLTAAKDYELIDNVKDPTYTLYIASGALAYSDFAVKALCDDTTESSVPAVASRVQTGPGILSILVIVSAVLSIFFVRRRHA